jgi:hypothetical protein
MYVESDLKKRQSQQERLKDSEMFENCLVLISSLQSKLRKPPAAHRTRLFANGSALASDVMQLRRCPFRHRNGRLRLSDPALAWNKLGVSAENKTERNCGVHVVCV